MTIAEVPEFIQRCRSDCLRHALNTSGFTRAVVLRVIKELLVIFLDGKNEPGRCLSHGQSVSVWDGKNIPTSRILCTYQSSTSQIIEEENSQFSRRISHVASTGKFPGQHRLESLLMNTRPFKTGYS